jgi:proline iminopeptidase
MKTAHQVEKFFVGVLRPFVCVFVACFSFANTSCEAKEFLSASKEVFVKADGAELFCRVFGVGSPVIVIHGGPGLSQDYLLPYMAKLGEHNCAIFYDQRACGLSTGDSTANVIRLETFVEDVELIRKAFGYQKVSILGHSWGGFLAVQYAIAHPESIDKLILLSTAPVSSEDFSLMLKEGAVRMAPYQEELKVIRETKGFAEGDPEINEKYFRITFRSYFFNSRKEDLLNFYMSPKALINGRKVSDLLEQNVFSKPFNFHDALKTLNMPTLIIHGDFDPIPHLTAQKIHEDIRGSTYILLRNCGHFPYVESPEDLFEYLGDFLQKKN